jgi:Amt family ammonium transporter
MFLSLGFLTLYEAKFFFKIDDALDLFAEHAVGGVIGLLANGLFASHNIIALDGVNVNVNGGWLDRNYKQLYIQFAYVCAVCAYTFVVTVIIAKAIDMIPGLHLKTTPEGENLGVDEVEVSLFMSPFFLEHLY